MPSACAGEGALFAFYPHPARLLAIRDSVAAFFAPFARAPQANGTKAAALAPPEAKSGSGVTLRFASSDFWPIDAASHTTLDLGEGSSSWYRAAWLAYACMSYRATRISEPPLWIREEKDGGESWITGKHPLAELLKRPNPDMRMRAFLERSSLLLDSTGRVVWVKVRDRGRRVAALRPFSGDDVLKIEAVGDRLFGRFRLRLKDKEDWFDAEDVIHLYNEDPADPCGCVAPLDAAADRLGIDRTLVQSIKAGLRNVVVPGMVLSYPENFTPTAEQRAETKASLAAGYANARNHGQSLIVGGGVTATQMRLGFAGLEGGELNKENEAAVCACFGLPPVIVNAYVGLAESSDRHNLETSRLLVYENVIAPLWTRIEEALTDDLLAEVDNNPLHFVRFVREQVKALREDMNVKATMVAQLRSELDLDERRALLGYGAATPEQREEIVASQAPASLFGFGLPKGHRPPRERKAAAHWAIFDAMTRGAEFGWQVAALQQLEKDRDALLRIIGAAKAGAGPLERKDDPPPPYGPADVRHWMEEIGEHMEMEAVPEWRQRVTPLAEATGRQAVERVALELGIRFDLLQPGLLEYVEKEAAWLVTEVTSTTKQSIRDALAAGLEAGESIPELRDRIMDAGAFSRSRAELIARSEVTRVSNGSQRDSLAAYQRESGDTIRKSWLTANDSRVRPEHVVMEGETVGIDEAFSNGLQAPGEPNCRCTLTYAMEAAA